MSTPFQQSLNGNGNRKTRGIYVNSRIEKCVIRNPQKFSLEDFIDKNLPFTARSRIGNQEIIDSDFYGCTFIDCLEELLQKDSLTDYQRDLVNKVLAWLATDEARAQFICSVAYGKTYVTPHILHAAAEKYGYTTLGIGFPWRSLADQSMERVLDTLIELCGNDHQYRMMLFHSGTEDERFKNDDKIMKVAAGKMNEAAIVKQYRDWIAAGYRVIIATLYQSAEKVFDLLRKNGIEIEFAIWDEAHNLSRDSKMFELVAEVLDPVALARIDQIDIDIKKIIDNLDGKKTTLISRAIGGYRTDRANILRDNPMVPSDIPVKRILFGTATPTSFDARGHRSMDEVAPGIPSPIFGREIYHFSFAELAERGQAIAPDIQIIDIDSQIADKMVEDSGAKAQDFAYFNYIIKTLKDAQQKLGPDSPVQCIVSVQSTLDIEGISGEIHKAQKWEDANGNPDPIAKAAYINDIDTAHRLLRKWIKNETGFDYDIISVSASTSSEERKKRYKQFGLSRHAIFVNCKVLREGVDFPEANCALLLRCADVIDAVQIFGRIVRVGGSDRARFKDGSLTPNKDYTGYDKSKTLFYIGDQTDRDVDGKQLELIKNTLLDYRDGYFNEEKSLGVWALGDLEESAGKDWNKWAIPSEIYDGLTAAQKANLEKWVGITSAEGVVTKGGAKADDCDDLNI